MYEKRDYVIFNEVFKICIVASARVSEPLINFQQQTGAVLLGLLLMDQRCRKSMQKLTNLLFKLLAIILEKRRGRYFPGL